MKCWECDNKGTIQFIPDYTDVLFDENHEIEINTISKRWYCKECYERVTKERKKDREEYVKLKKKLMLERAIRMLEKQNASPYDYEEAYRVIKEYSETNPDKFDSSHEMLAAIILIENEVHIKPQYKIAGYKVDFFLPEMKVVLEIDGKFHENSVKKDSNRDIKIREELGSDYEIVRINTKYIEQKAELLVEAIEAIREERQKVRSKNNGMLPTWYKK